MKPALIALAFVWSAAGCKKRVSPEDALEPIVRFKDFVCACKDLPCVAKATEELMKNPVLPDADSKAVQEYAEAAQRCIAKLGGPPMPTVPNVPSSAHADLVIVAARHWQQEKQPNLAIVEVTASYVESNGMLDPAHGKLAVHFGNPSTPVDDPKRKTGAPIAEAKRSQCPVVTFAKNAWRFHTEACREAPDTVARCTVLSAWKRSIDEVKAPADALAVLRFQNGPQPSWMFTISDEPRNVNVATTFADDCAPYVEQSK